MSRRRSVCSDVWHCRDLFELRDAAGARDIRLNNANCLFLRELANAVTSKDALTCCQRNVDQAARRALAISWDYAGATHTQHHGS